MNKATLEELLGLADIPRCRAIFTKLSSIKEHVNMRTLGESLDMGNSTLGRNLRYMKNAKIIVMETSSGNQKSVYVASNEEAKKFENIIKKY